MDNFLSYPTYSHSNVLFTALDEKNNNNKPKTQKRHAFNIGVGAPWCSNHLTRVILRGCVPSSENLGYHRPDSSSDYPPSLLSSRLIPFSFSPRASPLLGLYGYGKAWVWQGGGVGGVGRGTRGVTRRPSLLPHREVLPSLFAGRDEGEGEGTIRGQG